MDKVIFGGRLGEYNYYDMDQVIAVALAKVKELLAEYDSDPNKANLNYEEHSITFNQTRTVFTSPKTKRRFYDLKHTSILEYRYYALGKLKNHGIIRIDYTIRDGQIRLINAFKAEEADRERYYTGEEDFE